MFYLLKIALTAGLVVVASEVSRRSTLVGGFVAAVPLVSLLTMIWLYIDTGDAARVGELSRSVLWLVLPSLPLYLILPKLLEARVGFYAALAVSLAITIAAYGLTLLFLGRVGAR